MNIQKNEKYRWRFFAAIIFSILFVWSLIPLDASSSAEEDAFTIQSALIDFNVKKKNKDRFDIKGQTKGLSLEGAETVTFQIGAFEQTIPLDNFRKKGKRYVYKGGWGKAGIARLVINTKNGNLIAVGKRLDLSALTSPVNIRLQTGDFDKCQTVHFREKKHRWVFKKHKDEQHACDPIITSVSSSVFSKTGDIYETSSMVEIEVEGNFDNSNITEGTIRITSESQDYDSGVQELTPYPLSIFEEANGSSPPTVKMTSSLQKDDLNVQELTTDGFFYHWDTNGLEPASDYAVEITLYDSSGEVADDNSINITLTTDPSVQNILASKVDLIFPGQGLSTILTRTYMVDSGFDGPLGFGWTHTYLMHIVETADGLIKIFNPNGSGSFFKPEGNGAYTSPKGNYRVLTRNDDGSYRLREKNGALYFLDEMGKLVSIEDRNENKLEFYYNSDNRLSVISDGSGRETAFTYDSNGRIASVTDPAGRSVSYEYNNDGDLIAVTDIGGFQTTYAYDAEHNLTTITDPTGVRTFFVINADDRLEKVSGEGDVNSMFYNYPSNEPIFAITDALGKQWGYVFDHNGLVTEVEDPLGNVIKMSYDDNLNLTRFLDANGNQTTMTYDNQGNLLTDTDAQNNTTIYTYDPVFNQVTSITDPAGNQTLFNYDNHGNLTGAIYPDGSTETYAYDSVGNLVSKTDRMNQTIRYEYDFRGKVTRKVFPDSSSHEFSYDTMANLITASDENGTIYFAYDNSGLITHITYPLGETVSYAYDQAGKLTELVYPDGSHLYYEHDQARRLSQIRGSGQTVAAYSYDQMSRVTGRVLQNGTYTTYRYDSSNRMTELINSKSTSEIISQFLYEYDNAGNRIRMTTAEGVTQYVYDQINQLIEVVLPTGSQTNYNLDPVGNRIAVINDGFTTNYTTNSLNQYTDIEGESYAYDANGNLTQKTTVDVTTTYTYDFENHLVQVDTLEDTIVYAYDPLGRRILKATSAGVTRYIHSGAQVIMETDDHGGVQAAYVFGRSIDEVLMMKRDGAEYFYCMDGLGSVIDLTDALENVVDSFSYDAYGTPSQTSSIGNPYLFTGRAFDDETELYYYRARYYDPVLGRFLTPDPIGFAGGVNFYAYVNNDPISIIDPLGLKGSTFFPKYIGGAITGGYGMDPNGQGPDSPYYPPYDNELRFKGPPSGLPNRDENPLMKIGRDVWGYFSKLLGDMNNFIGHLQYNVYPNNINSGDPTFIQLSEINKSPKANSATKSYRTNNTGGLIARISVPYTDALVRANIPIFGLAYGKDFKGYRVEYGEGKNPNEWTTIVTSSILQSKDNSPQALDDSSDQTIHGNLATWDTGLKNYVYGDEYPIDHPVDLKGVYTVRLVVQDTAGATVEDRVTLEVGRVISNVYGGTAPSTDGLVSLNIPDQSIKDAFRLVSIKPERGAALPIFEKQNIVSEVYQFRPAGERFSKPAVLEMKLPDKYQPDSVVDSSGIFAYNAGLKRWEYLPTTMDKDRFTLRTEITGFPESDAYFAIMKKPSVNENQIISKLSAAKYKERYQSYQPSSDILKKTAYVQTVSASGDQFLMNTSFDNGASTFTNRDGGAGAQLELDNSVSNDGGYCLKLVNINKGGNLGVTINDRPFDAQKYPLIRFDYKISEDVKTNFLVKMDDRWFDIVFTDDPKHYRRLNIEKIGQIDDIRTDNKWRTAQFNLYEMLKNHPPLMEKKAFIIQEMVMADWDCSGYMKLVYGKNKKGTTYYLDNFSIRINRSAAKIFIAQTSSDGATDFVTANAFIVEDFENTNPLNALPSAIGLFNSDKFGGEIEAKIYHDNQKNTAMKVRYDVTTADDFAGCYVRLNDADLSEHHALSFWIKGKTGGEGIRVGLKNTNQEETKVFVGSFKNGGITQTWQKFSIPLSAFSGVADFARMDNVSFTFENTFGSTAGEVFIDNIHFEQEQAPMMVFNCSDGSKRNIWGAKNRTYNTKKANINAHYDQYGCLICYSGIVSSRDDEAWAGWTFPLNHVDVSEYSQISLRMKRIHGNEKPHVYLDDGKNRRFNYVSLDEFFHQGTEWETIKIPLSRFSSQGIDLTRLNSLKLIFEWEQMSGALYVDDIMFTTIAENAQ